MNALKNLQGTEESLLKLAFVSHLGCMDQLPLQGSTPKSLFVPGMATVSHASPLKEMLCAETEKCG